MNNQNLTEMEVLALLPSSHQALYQQLSDSNMTKAAAAFLHEARSSLTSSVDNQNTFGLTTDAENQEIMAALAYSSSQIAAQDVSFNPPAKEDTEDHSKDKKKTVYHCKYQGCDRNFTTLANMKRHEKLHSGEKPFTCTHDACHKSFARKYDLKVHSRTHTKEKPYQCALSGCGKRFSRVSSMREHERNIHGLTSEQMSAIAEVKEEVSDEPLYYMKSLDQIMKEEDEKAARLGITTKPSIEDDSALDNIFTFAPSSPTDPVSESQTPAGSSPIDWERIMMEGPTMYNIMFPDGGPLTLFLD